MATEELPLNLQNLRTDERDIFMDTRNYCIECDKPKPCFCFPKTRKAIKQMHEEFKDSLLAKALNSKPCDTE